MYSWRWPHTLLIAFREHHSSLIKTLHWFWTTHTHRPQHSVFWEKDRPLQVLLLAYMAGLIASGVWLVYWWAWHGTVGLWAFGLALLIGYPLIVTHTFAIGVWLKRALWYVTHPKKWGKAVVAHVLESQVRKLRKKHQFKVVVVAGSVGKTSTKLAIAQLVGQKQRVLYQAGNYNDRVTVPLVFFGQQQPGIFNLFAWVKIFGENTAMVHHPFPYDIVVLELGTDGPGQMEKFGYLRPDIGVLTAISPEHMEQFGSLDAVAVEELVIFDYTKRMLVNGDDIPGKYLMGRTFEEYSLVTNVAHNYYAKPSGKGLEGQKLHVEFPSGKLDADIRYVGAQGAKFAVAAAAVADMLGMSHADIAEGLSRLESFAGRMNVLDGVKGSLIIDDTYNASPIAVKAALDVLYARKATQRVAILGSMNELGDYAEEAHKEVGAYCDAKKLDLVVTVGHDAERWIAPIAKKRGCMVHSFKSAVDAGKFVEKFLKTGAVILAKGSQNGVFTEEAVKVLLKHPADSARLVRQSRYWLKQKRQILP